MINPYVGEVSCFGVSWARQGWLGCQGQLVSVQQYPQLFALIGKTFGGDGLSTFGLPMFSRITTMGGQFGQYPSRP
jgi:microcystin-dependent protein